MQPELTTIVQTALTWLTSRWEVIASVVAVILLLMWACARTGSAHILTTRLWHLLLGKPELKSDSLSKYLDERDALMRFRLVTGIRVATVEQAERLVRWARSHGVDIDLIRAAGHHFDVSMPGFKRPPGGPLVWIGVMVCAGLFLYGALIASAVGILTPPVIRVVKSDTWYAVDPAQTSRFSGFVQRKPQGPKFALSDCKDQPSIVKATGFPAHDVDVLCEVMSTPDGEKALASAHNSQRGFTALLVAMLLWLSLVLFGAMRRGEKAMKLHKLVSATSSTRS